MGNEWPIVRLGDYVDSTLGKMLDAQKNKGAPCPYLGNSNVRWGSFDLTDLGLMKFESSENERYGIRDGDLIVCEGGEPGRCAVWREQIPDMKIQKALHRIRPKFGLNNYYLFYWFMLAGRLGWLEPFFTGTTIKHLTGKALNELKVPLPPLSEQRAIAHILGTLDDKIELNRKQNETLEAMARTLFKAWFVDFEPVRAKMEGRWRRGDSLPGLPAHLYDLFPERLVDSELGEIPEGWEICLLGKFADLTGGKQLEKEKIALSGSVPVFGGAGLMGYTEKHNADGFIITVGRVGAYCGQFFSHRGKAWINNNASLIRQRNEYHCEWLFLSLCHTDIDVIKKGAAQPFVSNGDIAKLPLMWPGEQVVQSFSEMIIPLFKKQECNVADSKSLAQLRDTLLPKLISGELRVPNTKDFLKKRDLHQ
jgi:type I restriction enzyme S subunit